MSIRLLAALCLLACTPPDRGEPSASTADTGSGVTVVEPDAPLEVRCADTDNPLRKECTVTVGAAQAVYLDVTRQGETASRRFDSDAESSVHKVLVYFLAASSTYDVTAHLAADPDGEWASATLQTEALDPAIDTSLQMTGEAHTPYVGGQHPCTRTAVAAVWDTATGEVVWFHQLDPDGRFDRLNMVRFTGEQTVLGETGDDVVEVSLAGEELLHLEDVPAKVGATKNFWKVHHDIFRHEDHVYAVYREEYPQGELDTTVVLDRSGEVVAEWRAPDHLPMPKDWSGSWLHTNTLFVDAQGDLIMSWLARATIAKVVGDPASPDFGTPRWLLGSNPADPLPSDFVIDWSGVDGEDAFRRQHDVGYAPDGDLVFLDNLHGRGLRLQLDEQGGTATAIAAYPAGADVCNEQGTAAGTVDGYTLVGCAEGALREFDPSGSLTWEASPQCSKVEPSVMPRFYPLDGW